MSKTINVTLCLHDGKTHESEEIDIALDTDPERGLTKDEQKRFAFLTKMALVSVLRARKSDYRVDLSKLPPETTPVSIQSHDLRQKWLAASQFHEPPADFAEFITKSMNILREWYGRWHGIHKHINPKAFRTEEEKKHFLRENDLKALGLWHAMRELQVYWRKARVWNGDPFNPDDLGEVLPNGPEE